MDSAFLSCFRLPKIFLLTHFLNASFFNYPPIKLFELIRKNTAQFSYIFKFLDTRVYTTFCLISPEK